MDVISNLVLVLVLVASYCDHLLHPDPFLIHMILLCPALEPGTHILARDNLRHYSDPLDTQVSTSLHLRVQAEREVQTGEEEEARHRFDSSHPL